MNINKTNIHGCFELFPKIFSDNRGKLIKTFHYDTFKTNELEIDYKEEYYSKSAHRVLRGLHFQLPPFDHIKCVTCISGRLYDVVVDLRKDSPSFKKHFTTILDSELANMVYIPKGCAHGFYTLSDGALFLNRTTTTFNSEYDTGIKWDSCGIDWPDQNPILSEKDLNLLGMDDFLTKKSLRI